MADLTLHLADIKTVMDDVTVALLTSVYSSAFGVEEGSNFGVFLKVSGSNPHVKIVKCYNPSNSNPADATLWAEQDESGAEDVLVDDFTQTSWSIVPLILVYSIWFRFKCVGIGANGADTKITMKVVRQHKLGRYYKGE